MALDGAARVPAEQVLGTRKLHAGEEGLPSSRLARIGGRKCLCHQLEVGHERHKAQLWVTPQVLGICAVAWKQQGLAWK